jgi:NO-binding membrane sensor protein with MHYT domain
VSTPEIAAILFCATLALLALFQAALAAGAPLGRFAWGGQQRRLSTRLRIGSLVAIGIYAFFGLIALERVALIQSMPHPSIASIGIWVIAGYMALGVVMNAISRSKAERYTMTPLALVLLGLGILVALG